VGDVVDALYFEGRPSRPHHGGRPRLPRPSGPGYGDEPIFDDRPPYDAGPVDEPTYDSKVGEKVEAKEEEKVVRGAWRRWVM
jgi:hypothetical protein